MSTRAEQLVPVGWKPKPGARVALIADKEGRRPLGMWRVIDRAPEPTTWWLQPGDDKAREWAAHWPNQLVQGCLQAPARLLVPPWSTR